MNFVLPDFQTSIGYIDVKPSAPVYFYVQKNVSHSTLGIVPFEITRLNIGEAMSASAGIFTAPRNGIYSFHFSGVSRHFPEKTSTLLRLIVNDNIIGRSITSSNDPFGLYTQSFHAALELKMGDQVWIALSNFSTGEGLYEDKSFNSYYTHFTGHLL